MKIIKPNVELTEAGKELLRKREKAMLEANGPAMDYIWNDVDEFQDDVRTWADKNFDSSRRHDPVLGIIEEQGELFHAHLKGVQGIRGTQEEHFAKKKDAIGDIIVYLADFCGRNDVRLHNDYSVKTFNRFQEVRSDDPYFDVEEEENKVFLCLLGLSKDIGGLADICAERILLQDYGCFRGGLEAHVASIIRRLGQYCNYEGIRLSEAVSEAWNGVRLRDWKKNKQDGTSQEEQA